MSTMNPQAVEEKQKTITLARKVQIVLANAEGQPSAIRADKEGNLPKKIEVLKIGMWRTPYHGDIMITPDDLEAYVAHFNHGEARSKTEEGTYLGLPINFGHDQGGKAAGWMKSLSTDGETLFADVEWTEAGKQALASGEWKCFSPEFFPAGRGGWCDPLDQERFVENVLEGGALTNIPLFRGLKPIMASASFGKDSEKTEVFLIKASEEKENKNMLTLEEVRAKDAEALTEEEKTYLAEHKTELTAEEQTKFGLEVTPAATNDGGEGNGDDNNNEEEEPAATGAETPEAVAASIKAGTHVVIKADRLKALEDTAADYRREKAEAEVKAHVARGAIKADQTKVWTDKLVSDSTTKELLASLPDNPALADEQGSGQKAGEVQGSAWDKIKAGAEKIVADSKGAVKFHDAVKQFGDQNPELAKQHEQERES